MTERDTYYTQSAEANRAAVLTHPAYHCPTCYDTGAVVDETCSCPWPTPPCSMPCPDCAGSPPDRQSRPLAASRPPRAPSYCRYCGAAHNAIGRCPFGCDDRAEARAKRIAMLEWALAEPVRYRGDISEAMAMQDELDALRAEDNA